MLIYLVGDRGDGKSLTATKFALKKPDTITNFPIKKKDNTRLQVKHIFKPKDITAKTKKDRFTVNWDWWEKKKNYEIFIDEAYQNFSNRNSNSIENTLWSSWLAQSRKILGNQGHASTLEKIFRLPPEIFNKVMPKYINQTSNFWAISQTVRKVEVNFRELVNLLIVCKQIKMPNGQITQCNCYKADIITDAIENLQYAKPKSFYFKSNPYYGKYDTDFFVREVDIYNQECYL